jgi:hypothetical protein
MGLIKAKADYQDYLRTAVHLEFSVLEPHFTSVQTGIITQIFGLDFITALNTRWNAATPSPAITAEETYLVNLLQKAIASLGMNKAIPSLMVSVQGTGLQQAGKEKPLFEWQKLSFQDEIMETGWNTIGAALDYLFVKRTDARFTLWKDSNEEKTARQYLLNSANEFNNSFQICRSFRTFEALKPSIKEALNLWIKPVLGNSLLTEIITQNKTFTLSNNNAVLVGYINEALAQLTIAIAIYKLELQFNEEGARVVSVSATSGGKAKIKTAATEETKKNIALQCRETAYNYLADLKDYLVANAATYPLYTVATASTITNESGGTFIM